MKAYFSDPKRQLAALKPLLGSRQDLWALRHYLFEAVPEGLTITVTDLEVGLRVLPPGPGDPPGPGPRARKRGRPLRKRGRDEPGAGR